MDRTFEPVEELNTPTMEVELQSETNDAITRDIDEQFKNTESAVDTLTEKETRKKQ